MFWIDFQKPFFFLFSFDDQIKILNIQWDSTDTSNDLKFENFPRASVASIGYIDVGDRFLKTKYVDDNFEITSGFVTKLLYLLI